MYETHTNRSELCPYYKQELKVANVPFRDNLVCGTQKCGTGGAGFM